MKVINNQNYIDPRETLIIDIQSWMWDVKHIYGKLFYGLIFLCTTLLFNVRATNVAIDYDHVGFNGNVNVFCM